MSEEIAQCLELGVNYSSQVLCVTVIAHLKMDDKQAIIFKEIENSLQHKDKIPGLPLQDSFWCLKETDLKCNDLSHLRMLVLSDIGNSASGLSTVQFSLMEASKISYDDQACQLLYHGCLNPLDGRRSRKPRFLYSNLSKLDTVSSALQLTTNNLGIQFLWSEPSKNDFESIRQSFETTYHCRQCSVCEIAGSSDLFHSCEKCGAVLYCRKRCENEDWEETHHEWCSQFRYIMTSENDLAALPFHFFSETTKRDFDQKRLKEFLQNHGVYEQGLWQLEYSPLCKDSSSVGDSRLELHSLYGLEQESSLLELPPQSPEAPLQGWSDYYSLRGFSLNSPIAAVLHYALTLYYIISNHLPVNNCHTYESIQKSKKICVHLIGAEKEVEMFYPFLECARLLSNYTFHIHLFGNNISDIYHKQVKKKENLHFQIYKGFYHKANHGIISAPDVAVCFNGGIGAYTSYIKTIQYLTRKKTPFYYTDYGEDCILFSSNIVKNCRVGYVSRPQVNPFRSPFRMMPSDQNLPRYSNAFITHISPFQGE